MQAKHDRNAFFRAEQVRKLECIAVQEDGIESYVLMQRAGAAAFREAQKICKPAAKLLVLCGGGNNGGDGYVVATLAKQAGFDVTLIALVELDVLHGDARKAAAAWQQAGGGISAWSNTGIDRYDCIVDAIFGTGLQRPVAGIYRQVIEAVNAACKPVIAIDVPSGLHADTGQPMECAICAHVTITFIGIKQGLLTGNGRDYAGRIVLDNLGVSDSTYSRVLPAGYCITDAIRQHYLKPRLRSGHKGLYGHVLIVGGDAGMSGAPQMAGVAALRVGAGRVSVATRCNPLNSPPAELMVHQVETVSDIQPLLKSATVIVVGPGLAQQRWGKIMLEAVLQTQKPVIVDADGLNLLASEFYMRDNWILTPHPAEAARLSGQHTQQIESDRHAALASLIARYRAIVVLKGAATMIGAPDSELFLCRDGNPGMSSAGMGDVLAGVIAGLVAQQISLIVAARLGVYLHARAGDMAARQGERGMLASDLYQPLRELANPVAS